MIDVFVTQERENLLSEMTNLYLLTSRPIGTGNGQIPCEAHSYGVKPEVYADKACVDEFKSRIHW